MLGNCCSAIIGMDKPDVRCIFNPPQSEFLSILISQQLPEFNDALEWLAAMCSHIPDRGEQMEWGQATVIRY